MCDSQTKRGHRKSGQRLEAAAVVDVLLLRISRSHWRDNVTSVIAAGVASETYGARRRDEIPTVFSRTFSSRSHSCSISSRDLLLSSTRFFVYPLFRKLHRTRNLVCAMSKVRLVLVHPGFIKCLLGSSPVQLETDSSETDQTYEGSDIVEAL